MSVTLPPRTIEWIGGLDGFVRMIDQTKLPQELVMLEVRDKTAMWDAIKTLSVRGAPAIGIAAAMGAVLGIRDFAGDSPATLFDKLDEVCEYLASSRPTAVNLAWALERLSRHARSLETNDVATIKTALLDEAKRIRDEDAAMCRAIGQNGESLIKPDSGILTHCNAGSLATAEYGTALAPMYVAHEKGRSFRVFADETRPLLQGARLTAWELGQAGINVTLLHDGPIPRPRPRSRFRSSRGRAADRLARSAVAGHRVTIACRPVGSSLSHYGRSRCTSCMPCDASIARRVA